VLLKCNLDDLCKRMTYNPRYGSLKYTNNPIGFKRPSIIIPRERYQKVLELSELALCK